jgi:hypothetical protein
MFMCFETYSGPGPGGRKTEQDELFFGFFLGLEGKTLKVLPGFVELIAWDRTKKLYNFYELIDGKWHYRGDSRDVLDDVAGINVEAKAPQFGKRLRCSGCHTLGGPIMKELDGPHNDWWTQKHRLPTAPWQLQAGKDQGDPRQLAAHLFATATDASNLSLQVRNGINRLLGGGALLRGRSLEEQLRSLFSTMEMNLVSDTAPFKEQMARGEAIEVPQGFFVDARLAGKGPAVKVDAKRYREALAAAGARFPPEVGEQPSEARHAFLVPGRSFIDNRVLDDLIARGLLDEELVADVLAVDLATPVFSRARAKLIRHVPSQAKDSRELREGLIQKLRQAGAGDPAAQELLANLTDPRRTAALHRKAAQSYLSVCAKAAGDPNAVMDWLKLASQRRAEILAAETARNPRGNILERGFRLVFPADTLKSRAGALRLDPATGRVREKGEKRPAGK